MTSSFTADYDAWERQVLCSPGMVELMERKAEKVREIAIATAPVGPEDDPHRGLYKDSFLPVESGIREPSGAQRGRRAYAKVTNTAPYSVELEYGNGHTPKYRTLGKALDAAGD